MGADGRQPIGEFLLDDVLGEEFRQRSSLGAIFNGFEVAASDGEIVGGGECHDLIWSFRMQSCSSPIDGAKH